MGDIGDDQTEVEFEPFTTPAVPERVPVAVPDPEGVPAVDPELVPV